MKKMRGTSGIDELIGTKKADFILGFDSDDFILGNAGNDVVKGGNGNDQIRAGAGRDRLWGDAGNDILIGEGGKDLIRGGDGNDVLVGGAGTDRLIGGAGDDKMFSNTGNDYMDGGAGDDYYEIGRGKVTTRDRSGNDTYVVTADSTVRIDDVKGNDKVYFKDTDSSWAIALGDLLFRRDGDDLIIEVDGYKGETILTFFYADDRHRVEYLDVEDPAAPDKGYQLEMEAVLNLSNGDMPVRGTDLWDL